MKSYKLIAVLLMSVSFIACAENQQVSEFVVKPKKKKKLSSNALKEKIGDTAKKALDHTTHLTQQLGDIQCCFSLQQQKLTQSDYKDSFFKNIVSCSSLLNHSLGLTQKKLSTLQSSFSQAIEHIINNWRPFKKAKKKVLHSSFDCVTQVSEKLVKVSHSFERVYADVSKVSTYDEESVLKHIKKVTALLQKQGKVLADLQEKIAADDCLKTT